MIIFYRFFCQLCDSITNTVRIDSFFQPPNSSIKFRRTAVHHHHHHHHHFVVHLSVLAAWSGQVDLRGRDRSRQTRDIQLYSTNGGIKTAARVLQERLFFIQFPSGHPPIIADMKNNDAKSNFLYTASVIFSSSNHPLFLSCERRGQRILINTILPLGSLAKLFLARFRMNYFFLSSFPTFSTDTTRRKLAKKGCIRPLWHRSSRYIGEEVNFKCTHLPHTMQNVFF